MATAVDLTISLKGATRATRNANALADAAERARVALAALGEADASGLKATFNGAAQAAKQYRGAVEGAAKATQKFGQASAAGADATKKMGADAKQTEGILDALGASAKRLGGVIGGLGGAFGGVLAAAGVKELIALGEEGGALQAVSHRLERLGYTADNTADMIKRLGGGSRAEIEKLISESDQAGLSFEQMQAAASGALQVSIARGEKAADVYKQLYEAIATGDLDQIKRTGVIVDGKKAEEEYAKSIGLTAASLTEKQKIAARSVATVRELNEMFSGGAPDKYASNLSAVTDAFTDLGDEVKRIAGDALSDLGAVLGLLRGGKEASFASENMASRLQASQAAVKELEAQETRLRASVDRLLKEQKATSGAVQVNVIERRQAALAELAETSAALAGERKRLAALEEDEKRKQNERDAKAQAEVDKQKEEERRKAWEKGAAERARQAAATLANEYAIRDRELALIQDTAERELAILEEAHVRQLAMFDAQVARGEANPADRDRLLQVQEEEQAQLRWNQALAEGTRILREKASVDDALLAIEQGWLNETAAALSLEERMIAAQGENRAASLDLLKAKQALAVQQAQLNGASEEYIRKLQEVHAAELKAAGKSENAWVKWAQFVQEQISQVQMAVGAIGTAFDAVSAAAITPLRNELTNLEEQLASASALEAQAEAQAKNAKGTENQAAANEKVAASARKRAAAEQAVYKAKLDLIKAEEEAAETQKKLKVLEFTLQGAFAAAKAIEMAAVAADRFASYQYVAGAAAVVASASYAAAAAAYGVAAAATAKTPVSKQQKPQDPAELDKSTASSGDRNRRNDEPTVINVSFTGGALHTRTEVQDTIVQAWNAAQQRRGGAKAQGR